jgi:transcriptional regulator with XRE-family HTH domain
MGRASRHKPEKLAEKLQRIREQSGLSMSELVARIGSDEIPLYKADISKYETGKREPPLVILLRYALLGRVSVESLIDDELEMDLQPIISDE